MERVLKDHSLGLELSYFCFEFVMGCNVVRFVCRCVPSGLLRADVQWVYVNINALGTGAGAGASEWAWGWTGKMHRH